MMSTAKDCAVVRRMWMEEMLGRTLGQSELAAADRHVAQCSECRAERNAVHLLGNIDDVGPAPQLDDFSRRRWIDRAVDRSNRALERAEEPQARTAPRTANLIALAAAAAIAVAVGGVWLESRMADGPATKSSDSSRSVAAAPVAHLTGRIVLASGEVRSSSSAGVDSGRIQVGDTLSTGEGVAVATLDAGVSIRLERDSVMRIVQARPNDAEIQLDKGEVLVSVDPGHKGRKFRVVTADGTVEVKGTIFKVARREGAAATVSVFRGEVSVSRTKGETQSVRLGEKLDMESGSLAAFDDAEKGAMEAAMDSLSAIALDGEATLDVESLPPGAAVLVDGVNVGETPLLVSLRSGYRRLELSLEGRESIRELLRLADGAKTSRTFDLLPANAAAQTGSGPARTAPAVDKAAQVTDTPSANELLERARAARASGDFASAIGSYENLVAAFPETPVARASLVSLGQLYLDQGGNPARGLELFNKYLTLDAHGALAPEAAYGVAKAHRALGNTPAEAAALESFLNDFGSSSRAPAAAARLAEIR